VALRGNAATLAGTPGNDVMIRLEDAKGRHVRRRYSVRDLDVAADEFTLWITIDHEGPGSVWVKKAQPGDLVDVIGPRGKIPLDPSADWHLFVGRRQWARGLLSNGSKHRGALARHLHRRDRRRPTTR